MTMVKCIKSASGYWHDGTPYSFAEGLEYDDASPMVQSELKIGRMVYMKPRAASQVAAPAPVEVETATTVAEPATKRRGRPPGSRNKPKPAENE